ncbi:glutamate--tRNA ligase [Niabella ginsenosidivorans]|uniref:Glutamate--tRNA ligase n=1 Tax=Niabella ginsenosidivorans TaxID=1176587 RepID=A0A1A9HXN1_9BACT|nr:glutamate--tRNA ligase [Niabella ginsenosidivorans]ANH79579.1 glutamate--tRNA ligase [Niabella ginsenosidivorans]
MATDKRVRVRFAPSPTGGLHLGGVRTVLYNYLFAKQHGGDFILRIEDTDQTRFVPGAEEYIFQCLEWVGLVPDESVKQGGAYGPYRQSERKEMYRRYAEQLVENGQAYYAFDTPEELEQMRNDFKTAENPSPQYDHQVRGKMRNSLTLPKETVEQLLKEDTRYVIRIKMPENETVGFKDMIRGDVRFNTSLVDDKVLLKADGMPTYHLAVVVDDYRMKITHAFRGEEWLPSAPVHILLWQYLFGLENMPEWAHFPLILGPSGKLSKRDGAKYGFPVFAMNWTDPKTGELTEGFKEKGFLPEAFINLLAVLGWNDGTEQEIFSLDELIRKFSMDRVHSAGARFDYEKAKWFNQEWIKKLPPADLTKRVKEVLIARGLILNDDQHLQKIVELVKDRTALLTDFYDQLAYFFKTPETIDLAEVQPKWNEAKQLFFNELIRNYTLTQTWDAATLETNFKEIAAANQLKPGEVMLPLRIMLVGGKFGPHVFDIAQELGKEETIKRIRHSLGLLNE